MSSVRSREHIHSLYTEQGVGYLLRAALISLSEPLVDDMLFNSSTRVRGRIQRYRYVAPAPPFETIEVTPRNISWWNTELLKGWGLGQIQGGDWDTDSRSRRLEENKTRHGLRQRFIEGREWEDTVYVRQAAEQINECGSFWGYQSISEFKRQRCTYVDELYESIDKNEYVPDSGHDVPERDVRQNAQKHRHRLEPLVSIGRNGRLFYIDGIHQFTIAEILDIEIPVHVLARYARWQQIRDEVPTARESGELAAEIRDKTPHPDLDAIE